MSSQMDDQQEKGRYYVVSEANMPKDATEKIHAWLKVYNCQLAQVLSEHELGGPNLVDIPWLASEIRLISDGKVIIDQCRGAHDETIPLKNAHA